MNQHVEEYVSATKAASMCGWSTETLRRYRKEGKGPLGYIKTSASHGVYPSSEVLKFVEERNRKAKNKLIEETPR